MDQSISERTAKGIPSESARGWVLIASPVVAIVLAASAFAVASFAAVYFTHPRPTPQIQQFARALAANYYGQMGTTILIYVAMFAAIWLLLPKHGVASLRSYFGKVSWRTVWLALASGIGFAFLVGLALSTLEEHRIVTFHETPAERALLPHGFSQLGIGLLAIAIVAPVVEEIYFRGLLLRWLRTKMPLVLAAIPSAALFAATHFRFATHIGIEGWVLTAGLFVFGLFAAAWASASRSLWPSIAAHGMYNATLISAPLLAGQSH
jgi:membrane protease YdiL (CAAX protease family)